MPQSPSASPLLPCTPPASTPTPSPPPALGKPAPTRPAPTRPPAGAPNAPARRVATLWELQQFLCATRGVDSYSKLGVGPLLRHPLVERLFGPHEAVLAAGTVPRVATMDVLAALTELLLLLPAAPSHGQAAALSPPPLRQKCRQKQQGQHQQQQQQRQQADRQRQQQQQQQGAGGGDMAAQVLLRLAEAAALPDSKPSLRAALLAEIQLASASASASAACPAADAAAGWHGDAGAEAAWGRNGLCPGGRTSGGGGLAGLLCVRISGDLQPYCDMIMAAAAEEERAVQEAAAAAAARVGAAAEGPVLAAAVTAPYYHHTKGPGRGRGREDGSGGGGTAAPPPLPTRLVRPNPDMSSSGAPMLPGDAVAMGRSGKLHAPKKLRCALAKVSHRPRAAPPPCHEVRPSHLRRCG